MMYVVTNLTDNSSKSFNSFEESADFVKKHVEEMAYDLYNSDSIDKYAVEDILFDIENHIKKNNGYSHPDIFDVWEIKKIKEN